MRIESPSTQARAKGTVRKTTRTTLPAMPVLLPASAAVPAGRAHRPPISASREAQRAPSRRDRVDDHQHREVGRAASRRPATSCASPTATASTSIFSGMRRRSATTRLSRSDDRDRDRRAVGRPGVVRDRSAQHGDPEQDDGPEAVDPRRVSAEEVIEALHVTQRREGGRCRGQPEGRSEPPARTPQGGDLLFPVPKPA